MTSKNLPRYIMRIPGKFGLFAVCAWGSVRRHVKSNYQRGFAHESDFESDFSIWKSDGSQRILTGSLILLSGCFFASGIGEFCFWVYNIPLIAIKRPCVDLVSTIDFYEVGCPKMKVNAAKTPNFPTISALTSDFHPTSFSLGSRLYKFAFYEVGFKVGFVRETPLLLMNDHQLQAYAIMPFS